MNRLLPLYFLISFALASSTVNALGLGAISVKSDLNETLRAEIPVLVNHADEAKNLRANLAAAEEFARVGLNINGITVPIIFEVTRNDQDQSIIIVSSAQPVREPFLSFLMEVNWANGRLLREYSVLLDPPVFAPAIVGSAATVEKIAEPKAALVEPLAEASSISNPDSEVVGTQPVADPGSAVSAPLLAELVPSIPTVETELQASVSARQQTTSMPESSADSVSETVSEIQDGAIEPTSESVSRVAPPTLSEVASINDYGPVVSGETLWKIATMARPAETVSLNQMMLALWRANPAAFYQDNVNALKRGAILRIPGPEEIAAVKVAQAAVEILSQNRNWIEATRPTLVADASVSSPDDAFGSATSASLPSGSSRLELVPPVANGSSSVDRPGMHGGRGDTLMPAEVARTTEALASSQSEVSELRSRVKQLEDIAQKSERLIELKDSQLKALQDRLTAAEKLTEAATLLPSTVLSSNEQAEITEEITSVSGAAAPEVDKEAIAAFPESSKVEIAPLAESEPISPSPEAIAGATTTSSPPWYQNPLFLGGGAILLAGLAALGLYSSKRKSGSDFRQRNSLADAFAGGLGGVSAGKGEVDPAETELLNMLAFDPTDIHTHLDVLDYFYNKHAVEKFEAAAEAMYAQVSDITSPEWQSAVLMGKTIAPTHPLFRDQNALARHDDHFEDEFDITDFDADKPSSTIVDGHNFNRFNSEFDRVDTDTSNSSAVAWRDIQDFDLAGAEELAMATNTKAVVDEFDYSVNSNPPDNSPIPLDDFDFDLDVVGTGSSVKERNLGASSSSSTSTNDVVNENKSVVSSTHIVPPVLVPAADAIRDDVVATKIDLARAYIEMGDSEGARSMLEEVMVEGNPNQRKEAAAVLAEIR